MIAQSSDGINWLRTGQIPGVGGSNRIAEFGFTDSGTFGIVTTQGVGFQSADLADWSNLEVTKTEQAQQFVQTHTVKRGDTVWGIARANGVSISAIVQENSLTNNGDRIFVGQQLTITKQGTVAQYQSPIKPHSSTVPLSTFGQGAPAPVQPVTDSGDSPTTDTPTTDSSTDAPADNPSEESSAEAPVVQDQNRVLQPLVTQTADTDKVYVVRRGDTLIRIAFRNGQTVRQLVEWNSIRNVNRIFIGQRLIVGKDSATQSFHRVEAGDTVSLIAQLRNVELARVLSLNPSLSENSTLEVGALVRVQ